MTARTGQYRATAAEVIRALWDAMPSNEREMEQAPVKLYREACALCKEQGFENAVICCETALRLARQTRDSDGTASSYYTEGLGLAILGAIHLHSCSVQNAVECFQKAAMHFRNSNRYRSESVARMAIGEGYALILDENEKAGKTIPQDWEQALSAFQRSLNIIERLRATDETTIGLKMHVISRMDEVRHSFTESLARGAPSSAMPRVGEPPSGQAADAQPTEGSPQDKQQPGPRGTEGLKEVPIVGIVRAGPGRLAEQKHSSSLSLDAELARSVTHAIDIEGCSMVDEGIYPGDFVLIHEQQELERGELGVFLITYAGELTETTLKHYYPEADHVCLKSVGESGPVMLIIPREENISRIIKQYEQQGYAVHPYVNANLEIVAKAHGLFRLFDRVRHRKRR